MPSRIIVLPITVLMEFGNLQIAVLIPECSPSLVLVHESHDQRSAEWARDVHGEGPDNVDSPAMAKVGAIGTASMKTIERPSVNTIDFTSRTYGPGLAPRG